MNGFKVSNSLSVELLQFADDTIFLCDGGDKSIWCLKAILRSFELASGLKVNFSKSNVIGFNVEERILEGISQFLACRVGKDSFKFLGIPVGANPRRVATWQPVIDVIKARLNSWKSRQLSIGGRVTLINSVLASLPLYLFSFYKAPRKIIDEITKLQRRFLWGGDEESKKMAWVRWNTLCTPKDKGGLGIKNLEAFNIALLTKWRWRLLVEEGSQLWSKLLVARYGINGRWPRASEYTRGWGKLSIWWRDLCILGEGSSLEEGWSDGLIKLKLGRGNLVKFWTDSWLGRDPIAALFPRLFDSCCEQNAVVEDMGLWTDNGWKWTVNMTSVLQQTEQQQLDYLLEMLLPVTPKCDISDTWSWTLDPAKGFTVKRSYEWLIGVFAGDNEQFSDSLINACKKLWRNDAPSKITIFAWRVLHNRIATREALFRRGVIHSQHEKGCVFCFLEDETVSHLFLNCHIIKNIWQLVFSWLGEPYCDEDDVTTHFMEFGKMIKGKRQKRVKHLIWLAVIWNIWMARNRVVFKGEVLSIPSLLLGIKDTAWCWFKARKGKNCQAGWAEWYNSPLGVISTL